MSLVLARRLVESGSDKQTVKAKLVEKRYSKGQVSKVLAQLFRDCKGFGHGGARRGVDDARLPKNVGRVQKDRRRRRTKAIKKKPVSLLVAKKVVSKVPLEQRPWSADCCGRCRLRRRYHAHTCACSCGDGFLHKFLPEKIKDFRKFLAASVFTNFKEPLDQQQCTPTKTQ